MLKENAKDKWSCAKCVLCVSSLSPSPVLNFHLLSRYSLFLFLSVSPSLALRSPSQAAEHVVCQKTVGVRPSVALSRLCVYALCVFRISIILYQNALHLGFLRRRFQLAFSFIVVVLLNYAFKCQPQSEPLPPPERRPQTSNNWRKCFK